MDKAIPPSGNTRRSPSGSGSPQSDDAAHLRLFDVPIPEREQNGIILAPGTATLRIQQ